MANTDVKILLRADGTAQVLGEFNRLDARVHSTAASAERLSRRMAGFASALGLAFGGSQLIGGLRSIITEADKFERNQLRTEALLRATGEAAGFTADQLRAQASALALATLQSVEGVEQAQQVLLSFKRVSGETFTQAIELAADMATLFNQDLRSSVTQLGKALEDPVAGLSALRRVGVSFSADQKAVIQSLAETGRLMEAQGVILDALSGQLGGVARREALGLSGAYDTLSQRVQEAKIAFDELLGLSDATAEATYGLAGRVATLTDRFREARQPLANFVTGLGELKSLLLGALPANTWISQAAAKLSQLVGVYQQAKALLGGAALGLITAPFRAIADLGATAESTLQGLNNRTEDWTGALQRLSSNLGSLDRDIDRLLDVDTSDYSDSQLRDLELGVRELEGRRAATIAQMRTYAELIAQEEAFTTASARSVRDHATALEEDNRQRRARGGGIDQEARALARVNDAVARHLTALRGEEIALADGERAAFDYRLALEGIAPAERALILERYDAVEALKALTEEQQRAADAAIDWGEVMGRTADRVTDAFGEFFTDVFSNGVRSFGDLADAIKGIFTRLLAELAAAAVANPIRLALGIGGGGGLLGSASAGATGLAGADMAGGGLSGSGLWSALSQGWRGLFSGNSLGSSLASGLGWLTGTPFAAPGGGLTAVGNGMFVNLPGASAGGWWSSALGNLAGASNLGLIGGGLLGGLLGNALFGGEGYGGIGSSLGAAGGSVLAAGLGFTGPVGLIAGGLLGGLGGGFLGSLFGRDKKNNEWMRLLSGAATGRDARYAPLAAAEGPFGRVAVSGWEDLRGTGGGLPQALVSDLVQADTALASVMSETQIAAARAAVDATVDFVEAWADSEHNPNADTDRARSIAAAVRNRYARLFDAIDEELGAAVRGAAADVAAVQSAIESAAQTLVQREQRDALVRALREWVGEVVTFARGFAGEAPSAAPAAATLRETYAASTRALDALLAAASNSVEWLERLRDLVPQVYGSEVAYLTQIRDLQAQSRETIGGTSEQIRLALMDDAGRYEYFRTRANEAGTSLGTITDPGALAAQVEAINRDVLAAWNAADQAQRAQIGEEFLAFLEDLERVTSETFGVQQAAATAEGERVRSALEAVLAGTIDANTVLVDGLSLAQAESNANLERTLTTLNGAFERVTGTQLQAASQFQASTSTFASSVATLNSAAQRMAAAVDQFANTPVRVAFAGGGSRDDGSFWG